jgi:hypothetical protein
VHPRCVMTPTPRTLTLLARCASRESPRTAARLVVSRCTTALGSGCVAFGTWSTCTVLPSAPAHQKRAKRISDQWVNRGIDMGAYGVCGGGGNVSAATTDHLATRRHGHFAGQGTAAEQHRRVRGGGGCHPHHARPARHGQDGVRRQGEQHHLQRRCHHPQSACARRGSREHTPGGHTPHAPG